MSTPWIGLPEDTTGYFGFVYKISIIDPEKLGLAPDAPRYYIGRKQILKRVKLKPLKGKKKARITFKDNNVDGYWGSSKELLAAIEKYGIENFQREILEMTTSKWHNAYAEAKAQFTYNVLLDPHSFNGILNLRITRAPKSYLEHQIKLGNPLDALLNS